MRGREEVLRALASAIPPAHGRPARVAIDGMTGVGKTTLRSELAHVLRAGGREVLEASGDDFHHQREHRWRQGRQSARGYYEDAYDYEAMRAKLLEPLGPSGDRMVRFRHHDLESDNILEDEPAVPVATDAVLLVDGSFLLRPEIAEEWDFHILVEASREASVARQHARDGSPADAADPYYERYFGGYDIYVAERNPRARADAVVDNSDLDAPRFVAHSGEVQAEERR